MMVAGCRSTKDTETARRLERTIANLNEHGDMSGALPVLRGATPESLKTPTIVQAKMFDKPRSKRLWVTWVQDYPSVDAIALKAIDPPVDVAVPIDAIYREENEREAKEGVIFRFVVTFDDPSVQEQWERLKGAVPNLEVMLLRDGRAISSPLCVVLTN